MLSEKTRIVVIPPNDSHMKNFRIPHIFIKLIFGFMLFLILGAGFLIWQYSNKVIDENRLAVLEKENQILESKVKSFDTKLAVLQQTMNKYVEFDKNIRMLVDLPDEDNEVRKAGIGGPVIPDSTFDLLSSFDTESSQQVKSVEYNLDQLIREAKFQEHSFKNIITSIKSKQHVWDHTPSIRPLEDGKGLKVSGFGFRRDPFTRKLRMHEGIDFAERRGTPILATADGEVVSTGRRSGYGLAVEIDHGYGYSTLYAHCSMIKVKEGDKVKRGDMIALVGSTGRSKGPHVHYEVRVANRPVDPERYLLPEVVTD